MANAGGHREATRLFGAADAIRQHMGQLRFKVHQASYHAAVMAVRNALGERTVQTHLTHIYNKLGLSSRVPPAQEIARHT